MYIVKVSASECKDICSLTVTQRNGYNKRNMRRLKRKYRAFQRQPNCKNFTKIVFSFFRPPFIFTKFVCPTITKLNLFTALFKILIGSKP